MVVGGGVGGGWSLRYISSRLVGQLQDGVGLVRSLVNGSRAENLVGQLGAGSGRRESREATNKAPPGEFRNRT